MAWADASQSPEAMPVARTGCDFAVSNRPAVSTPATATCRCRCQSLTASGMIYDQASLNQQSRVVARFGALARGIAGEDADLTILDLAKGATVLPRDTHGVLPLFDKARLIEHQYPIGVAQLRRHQLVVVPQHLLLIPPDITQKPLHPAHSAAFDVEGHRLNGLPFQPTELAY